MPVKPIEHFKNLFLKGYIPTQEDYADIFDTMESFKSSTNRQIFKFLPEELGDDKSFNLPPLGIPTFSILKVLLKDGTFVTGRLGEEYHLDGLVFSQSYYQASEYLAAVLLVDYIDERVLRAGLPKTPPKDE